MNRIQRKTSGMLHSGLGDKKDWLLPCLLALMEASCHALRGSQGKKLREVTQPTASKLLTPSALSPQGSESCNHVSIAGSGAFGVQP